MNTRKQKDGGSGFVSVLGGGRQRRVVSVGVAMALTLLTGVAWAGTVTAPSASSAGVAATGGATTADCIDGIGCARCFVARSTYAGSVITVAYREAHAFLGSTPEEVQEDFAAAIERNLARADAPAVFARLSDKELGILPSCTRAQHQLATSIFIDRSRHDWMPRS